MSMHEQTERPPPDGMPRLAPYLLCQDVGAEIAFLAQAFGFHEREGQRHCDDEGRIRHAEVALGDAVVLLGHPGAGYRNPRASETRHGMLYVYVDDADTHHERAAAAGADIVSPPEDAFYGDRRYAVRDPEGHEWWFASRRA